MNSAVENELLKHQTQFHSVVNFDTATEKIAVVNLSESNTALTEDIFSNTKVFSDYIDAERKAANAKFLIGGYNELRAMYKRSALFNFVNDNLRSQVDTGKTDTIETEPRRLHLGIDIWGAADTKIFAPLGGMVHSFANNENFGDYGATIILQHQLETVVFHTLYGHLALKDIIQLKPGQFVTRGQCFAHFGNSFENGNWPPHLHFQIIEDMEMKEGDYPGVCKLSEREKYLRNCPDADIILNMMPQNHV